MNVLVCEDEEIMLTALEFRLQKQGFKVMKAKDGQQALTAIDAGMPDLIIADILMPHVTGLEIVQHVREKLKQDIPIIIISALENDDIVLEAFKLGANDFVTKPFKPVELVLRIKKILQEKGLIEN